MQNAKPLQNIGQDVKPRCQESRVPGHLKINLKKISIVYS
jgi:hypothetical protein